MNDQDHEARQTVARLQAQFEAHLNQCGERYKSLEKANERVRDALKGLYDRWWWIMATMVCGMASLLAKDLFL